MNCHDARQQRHAYSDHELDLVRRVQIEEHLANCAECSMLNQNLQILKDAVGSNELYHRAPDALRTRIQLVGLPIQQKPVRSLRRQTTVAAGILLVVGISAMAGFLMTRVNGNLDERYAESVLAGHIRSLQVDHAMDVASSDQHTVKPWFQGKLDFAPQVPDLSPSGFVLTGGRLDYLVDKPVAALIYHRRLHPINVFIYPASNAEETRIRRFTRQGFHIRHWQQGGMTYWAISDLNDQELDEFSQGFRNQLLASQSVNLHFSRSVALN